MIKKDFIIRNIYTLGLALLVLLSYLFSRTRGLAVYGEGGSLFYIYELLSSGSDDNVCIEMGSYIFMMPFAYSLVRFWKRICITDILLFSLAWLLQLGTLFMIEVGSIFDTILYGRNVVLLLWMLIFGLLPIPVGYSIFKSLFCKFKDKANESKQ